MFKKIIIYSSLVVLLLSFVQIGRVNQMYPNATVAEVTLGETIEYQNVHLTATNMSLAYIDSVDEDFEVEVTDENGNTLTKKDVRVLLVDLSYQNLSSEKVQIPLFPYTAVCGGWSNGVSQELFSKLNPEKSLMLNLAPQEKTTVTLPYIMYSIQFVPKKWGEIEKYPFELVLSFYPTKSIIKL